VNSVEPRAINTYTYVKGDEMDEVLWVGDNYRQSQPDNSTKFLESYIRTPESFILEGFESETISMDGYHDDWGYHVSAYGPITDSNGIVVGAVGIDFLANYVEEVQAGIRQTMTWALVIAVIVLFGLVFGMARYLTLPIVRLTRAAQGVGEGNYDQDFSAMTQDRFPDEIDVLASNFAAMVDKVYKREQKLRQQVEELKIEIDEAKRSSQVSEIVDTDFFRDLQAKATRMRSRRSQQGEAAD
jgi:methyl-accepting chemotaxis protein